LFAELAFSAFLPLSYLDISAVLTGELKKQEVK
jgi:hypothetical protein